MVKAYVKNEKTVKAMEAFAELILSDVFRREHKAELSIGATLFLAETAEYKGKEGAHLALIAPEEDGKFIVESLASFAKGDFNVVDLEEFSCKFIVAIKTAKFSRAMNLI